MKCVRVNYECLDRYSLPLELALFKLFSGIASLKKEDQLVFRAPFFLPLQGRDFLVRNFFIDHLCNHLFFANSNCTYCTIMQTTSVTWRATQLDTVQIDTCEERLMQRMCFAIIRKNGTGCTLFWK